MRTDHRLLTRLSAPQAGLLALLPLLAGACTGGKAGSDSAGTTGDTRSEGVDTTVSVFAQEYVYYGAENRRSVDVEVSFPDDSTTYSAVAGHFRLSCPNDACDWWDRYGTFGLVVDPGTDTEQYIELDRFITAYQVGYDWDADLTAVRPLLTGTVTMRVFIDTWVAQGSSNGDGWLFDADIDFVGGPPPSPEPVAVVPVWGHLSWSAGLDDNPVQDQVIPQTVDIPADATKLTFRSFITGHGWNNSQNCAEFCAKTHFYTIGPAGGAGTEFSREVWRDDCSETVTDGTQQGTWQYDRAGWCPGAQVFPWDTDVSDQLAGQQSADVSYRLEDFTWAGDGDQPYYYMSGLLIAAR
ncbi:MAG: hypothetical protein GXP62_15230 [Oligoflexia bacterium]|nr:hypothetical protein [Oligoflexia bacterium]